MQIVQVDLLHTQLLRRALELAAHELGVSADTVVGHHEAELRRDEDVAVPGLLEPFPDNFFAVALCREARGSVRPTRKGYSR